VEDGGDEMLVGS